MSSFVRVRAAALVPVLAAIAACSHSDAGTGPVPPVPLTACTGGAVQLAANQAARVDCANGGNSLTLAGNGASYLLVPQFASGSAPDAAVAYTLSNPTASPSAALAGLYPTDPRALRGTASISLGTDPGLRPPAYPRTRQMAFDRALRAAAFARFTTTAPRIPAALRGRVAPATPGAAIAPATAALGSTQDFQVRANFSISNPKWKSITARLAYAGGNILLYVDTLAPPGGFTSTQLQSFGQYFDQTLYPIAVDAYGPPSDVDQNTRVIMLMSPAVNSLSPKAQCATQGYVEGYFDEIDLGDLTSANSNKGEIFYSIVPDTGVYSCTHTVDELLQSEPATFLHELQHLIDFSQHVVVHGGNPQPGWLDEGMSIVAEELGSMYYEQKCPPPSCRTSSAQLFPDSSQGFIQGFLYDSYTYLLRPDTASVTLHNDAENGFSWRGGDWLLAHYLYDQKGSGILKALEQTTTTGIASIEATTSESFPALFADFGLTAYTDSLPGQPRTDIPARDRLTTRNLRLIYNRLFVTGQSNGIPSPDFPRPFPIVVQSIGGGTVQTGAMVPGTSSYYRVDTPSNAATVQLLFSQPGGSALPANLQPQVAVYRLPPGF